MLGHELKQLDKELKQFNEKADDVQKEYGEVLMTTDMYRDLCKMHLAAKIQELRVQHEKAEKKASEVMLENMARADAAYKKNFIEASKAYKKSLRLKCELDRLNDKIDSWRTRVSYLKAQVERFGG